MKQKMIDFLLTHANPSIQLRVKKEILRTITAREEKVLQERILDEKIIRFIAEKQRENWRTKIRRQCDITFRALMIAHYAGF